MTFHWVLICISLVTNDLEHLLVCLFIRRVPYISLVDIYSDHLPIFIGLFVILWLRFLCILDMNPLSDVCFANIRLANKFV